MLKVKNLHASVDGKEILRGIALAVKAVFFVLAFTGYATMWMAVFADVGTSLIVSGIAVRALRK